jgi:hypothetical protein
MRDIEVRRDGASVHLTANELHILSNALNEILNGIAVSEFETRLGATRVDVSTLLENFVQTIEKVAET